MKKNWVYFIFFLLSAFLALGIDLYTSNVDITIGTRNILNQDNKVITINEIIYPFWFQISSLIKNFFYALSAAIFITAFVTNQIEKSQRNKEESELKKLNNSININVFDSLFKTIIPKELFKIIKQDIIESKIIRKNARWLYSVKDSSKNNIVLMTATTHYQIHNISRREVKNPIKMELFKLGDSSQQKLISIECKTKTNKVLVKYIHTEEESAENVDIKKEEEKTSIEAIITVPADDYVEYTIVYEQEHILPVTDGQFNKVPVIDAELVVNVSEGIDFFVLPITSSNMRLITNTESQQVYSFKGGLLPWQGFMYTITRKNA